MKNDVPIGPGVKVTLRFKLSLQDGELIDETGEKAATFVVGDGNLLPGFEHAMFGLRAGARESFEIAAEAGFGAVNEENVHMMKKRDFSSEIALEEGLVVSFADQDGQERPGVVKRVFDEIIEVDFNHPLAGQDLIFEVDIVEAEQISANIIRV